MPLPLLTTEPFAGSLKLKVRESPSGSDPLKAIAAVAVSSSVVRDVDVETVGASFTALMVTLMISSTSTVPLLAVSVKLSEPLALASGV